MNINRRQLLGSAAAAAALPAMPAFAQSREIRHFWWGNPTRDANTFKVIDIFQANHPGISVSGETIGWGDYWTKMATQTAGGNMADVIQMAHSYIHEYVGRGGVLPLDQYVGNGIDLSHFDDGANDVGTVDGQLFGINIGSTSQTIPYNKRVFEDAGVDIDPLSWTTDDFANACEKITSATGGATTGSEDLSLYIELLEVWVRQNGRELYTPDGGIAMTQDDVRSFWEYWGTLREAGVIEAPDRTVILDKGMAELGIVRGTAACTFRWANQAAGIQSLTEDPIGTAMVPHQDGKAFGHYVLPSMFLCMTRDVGDVEAALAYINDWIKDEQTLQALGIDRGIPPSQLGRDAIAATLTPIEQDVVGYFGAIQSRMGGVPVISPKGAGEVRDSFMRTGTEVVLGNMPADEGAGIFIQDAEAILVRANR